MAVKSNTWCAVGDVAIGPRDPHDTGLRRAARAGLRGAHDARTRQALVGEARHHASGVRDGFRPGGAYRFVQRGPDGAEHGFRGEYRDIVPPARLVYTFEYEGLPGHIAVETLTFDEADGKTTLTSRMLFDSNDDRDGMLQSGMEDGASQTMDRLAAYLELLTRTA